MNQVVLPVGIIAGITLYAGLYHVLIHARVPERRDLYFGMLALLLTAFDLACVGLYTSEDVSEGAGWQRLSLVILAYSSTCLIYFIDEFTGVAGPKWARRASWLLVVLGSIALIERRGWLLTGEPLIKRFHSVLFGQVVYYEQKPGPLFYLLYAGVLYVVVYAAIVARRTWRSGRAGRARALIAGILVYMGGFALDGLIEIGWLRSVFVVEYAFAAIIALMGYSMSAEFAEAMRAKQALAERDVQLAHAQRLESLGKLAGGVAHDLNNFLTPVIGYVGLAAQRLAQGSSEREYLEQALSAAERAAALTQQLLALGRKQVLEVRALDVGRNIEQLAPLLRHLLPESVTLEVQKEEGVPWVEADAGQLEQVWMNLAANARDAMPQGGALTFAVRRGGSPGSVEVNVRDTGVGMSREQAERVFEPFFTTKARGQGTGLGLSIVRGIVEQHGGQIEVESAPGRGTTFTLRFAGTEPKAEPSLVPAPIGATRELGTVLVVDDDFAVRTFVQEVLTQHGYETVSAASVAEVRTRLGELAHLDLLLSDVMLEDGDGPMVRTLVAARFPGAPCLFMTGHADELIAPRGMLREGMALLRKPFTAALLLAKVCGVLEGVRASPGSALRGSATAPPAARS